MKTQYKITKKKSKKKKQSKNRSKQDNNFAYLCEACWGYSVFHISCETVFFKKKKQTLAVLLLCLV